MKVHHLGYLVKKMEAAKARFVTLGYSPVSDCVYDSFRDVNIAFLEKDGYVIELVSPQSQNSVVYNLLKKYKNMPYHICYESDSFDEDIERLSESGFIRIDDSKEAPALGGRRVCFMMSSTIGMIELLEGEGTP